MGFTFLWQTTSSGAPVLYFFGAKPQPAAGCWVGAFVVAINGQVFTPPSAEISAADLISAIQFPDRFPHVGFVFLPSEPTGSSGLAGFLSAVTAATQRFPAGASGNTSGGLVLWLDALGPFDESACLLGLPNIRGQGSVYTYTLSAGFTRFLKASEPEPLLALDAVGSTGTTLSLSPDGNALSFALGGRLALTFGPQDSASEAVVLQKLSVPLFGPQAGCLTFSGTSGPAFTTFGLGFVQAVAQDGGVVSAGWYPLLDPSEFLAKAGVDGCLDGLGGTTAARNRLTVTPAGGSFVSAYRTQWDEPVEMAPGAGAGFCGAPTLGGRLYFVPDGPFVLRVPSAAAGGERRLICGLSAIESLGFHDGDSLTFSAYPTATVTATNTGTVSAPSWSFRPSADESVGTARAYLLAAKSGDSIVYRSESGRAPFFAPVAGGNASLLRHDGLALGSLVSPPPSGGFFPLLPYAAVKAGSGFAANAPAVAELEFGCFAPARSAAIEAGRAAPPKPANPLSIAVTPQGYIAEFADDGGLLRLTLGSNGASLLRFDGGGTALPQEIRDLFLAPQQFVVISCDTAQGYVSKYLKLNVTMDGWGFDLSLPNHTDVAPGDYKTVIVIKAAERSVTDIAANPAAWTGYGLFNDQGTDPDGLVMSSWLSGYIGQAKAQYAAGLDSLENFCTLVDDAGWDGFLILRVPVSTGKLDPALGFLLAGVDPSALIAHHLGSESNQTTPVPGSDPPAFDQDSAFFGLVHYVRPGTAPDTIRISPPFVPSTLDYDFQLLTLDAIFANDQLQHFSSAALVVMNEVFGDAVLASVPPSASNPNGVATNALLIQGAMQHHDGHPAYSFATAPGSACTFYLSGDALDRVQIDRAQVALDTTAATTTTATVVIGMSGWLGMLADDDLDLLSYAGISFTELALRMTYDTGTGGDRVFAFDPSGLTLAALDEIPASGIVTPSLVAAHTLFRPGSLASTFPLKVDRLVVGAGKSPTDLGFQALTTAPALGGGDISGQWYGLQLQLPLGGPGALDSANLLSATLLFAWAPGGMGAVSVAPFIKISGPGGISLDFQLEGILKFGAKGLLLSKTADGVYVLAFRSIGLTLFSLSFPPAGSTNLIVAGLPDRSLGWFGAYTDPNAHPIQPPPSLGALT